MLVNDRVEWQYVIIAIIGTLESRLSSKPCGHVLNSGERSGSVHDNKPTQIHSRASQKAPYYPWVGCFMHYSCSGRCALC